VPGACRWASCGRALGGPPEKCLPLAPERRLWLDDPVSGAKAAIVLSAVLTLWAPLGHADEPTMRADALFDAGKRLMDAGSIADACRTFSESYALEPTGGTLLNLGVCLEKQGKLASAVETFERALVRAKEDDRADRANVAQNHLSLLRPRLSFLVLALAPSLNRTRMVVTIDDQPWPEAAWETPRALDPGEHKVSFGELGAAARTSTVNLTEEGKTRTLTLRPAPPKPKTPAARPRTKGTPPGQTGAPSWLLPSGIVASALGGIGLAIGTGFGVEALNVEAEVTRRCPTVACGDQSVVDLNDDFDRAATASTASFIAGGILSAVGVGTLITVYVLDRPKAASAANLRLELGAGFVTVEAPLW